MNNKTLLFIASVFGAGLGFYYLRAEESFVILKKKTMTNVKEQCCNYVADTLKESPETIAKVASMQGIAMEIMEEMVGGTFFGDAKKIELQNDIIGFKQFAERQSLINDLQQKQIDFLDAQKKKYSTKKS